MILDRINEIRENARLNAFLKKYERVLVPVFLIAGFLMHYLTFRTLEVGITFAGLGVYAVLAALSIVYSHTYDSRIGAWKHPLWHRLRLLSPYVVQLAFGSLLSMAFLFYWFSGALSGSWPVLAVLVGLVVSNEAFRHHYLRPTVQVGVFSFALFSYLSLLFPYLFDSLDESVFLVAGGVSTALSLVVVLVLTRLVPGLRKRAPKLALLVLAVAGVMNSLYFLNIIPPIPLSLRDAGIYHSVRRLGSNYALERDPETFWEHVLPGQRVYQAADGTLYAYTAIYAPADLNTTIYDRWEFYDPAQKKWTTYARLSFPMTGGRTYGYRGYTFVKDIALGKWRVTVETERGQVIGRLPFTYLAAP